METTDTKELQQIKGIGPALAQRLVEAGVDGPAKLVELGEEGLKQLRGVSQRVIPSIIEQARALAEAGAKAADEHPQELQQAILRIREEVQRLVATALETQGEKLADKKGAQLEKQLRKLLAGLENANASLEARPKRAAKGLAKIEKRVGGLSGEEVKILTKGLRKARKPLKRFAA